MMDAAGKLLEMVLVNHLKKIVEMSGGISD